LSAFCEAAEGAAAHFSSSGLFVSFERLHFHAFIEKSCARVLDKRYRTISVRARFVRGEGVEELFDRCADGARSQTERYPAF